MSTGVRCASMQCRKRMVERGKRERERDKGQRSNCVKNILNNFPFQSKCPDVNYDINTLSDALPNMAHRKASARPRHMSL